MTQKPRVLLIQQSQDTPPGNVLPWLIKNEFPVQIVQIYKGEALPLLENFEHLVLCGGAPNVDQGTLYPWLNAEKAFVERSLKEGKKAIGLCLGAQICADVLGSKVYPHPEGWEVGWHSCDLMGGKSGVFFQYHRYVFEAPKDAVVTASNDWWPSQAFALKDQVMAFQFHPEAELTWTNECADDSDLPTSGRVHNSQQIISDGLIYQTQSQSWFEAQLAKFLNSK